MAAPAFEVRPDPRCLRGLHFVYVAPALTSPAHLIERVRQRYPDQLVEGVERWADTVIQRVIVQFRFELRLGTRPGEISFLHRAIASPAQRTHDRAAFEASLLAAIAEVATP